MQSLHDTWLEAKARRAEDAAKPAATAASATPAPPHLDLPDTFDVAAAIESSLEPSRRADGWTAQRQRAFCELVGTGATIESAARAQGLSASSAYSFRNSARGAAFAIGWTAAQLLQRQRLADVVASRAFEGQTVTITRADGSTVERHFHDNRLAMSVLARLDRLAAGQVAAGTPDTSGEGQAARLAAAEFDRYLDILGAGDGGAPARAGLFLAARTVDAGPGAPELAAISTLARADLYARTGAGVVAEVDTCDLDPAARADWTAAQWARAEAAGLLVVAPVPDADGTAQLSQGSTDEDEDEPVWWNEKAGEYRTDLPCPDEEVVAFESGEFGEEGYERTLTPDEQAALDAVDLVDPAAERAEGLARRARWLQRLRSASAPDATGGDETGGEGGLGTNSIASEPVGQGVAPLLPAEPAPISI